MGKVEVKIPHCVWRGGRPRFVPGPRLRALGFEGRDLAKIPADAARRAGVDRQWMTLAEVEAWIRDELVPAIRSRELDAKAKPRAKAKTRPTAAPSRPGVVTVADLVEKAREIGKTSTGQPLKPASVAFYAKVAKALVEVDPELWVTPAASVKPGRIYRAVEAVAEARGLGMAQGVHALLARAWREAVRRDWGGISDNPTARAGVASPQGRLRAGTPAEMRALVAAADAIGRPEVGDCIVLGLMTGQRQADRLSLERGQEKDGWITFRQAKTGAEVEVPAAPWLADRLAAAAERRRSWTVQPLRLVVNEISKRPFTAGRYNEVFRQVRAAAVAGVAAPDGSWIVEKVPTLADFRDQDLRDTFITWCNDMGATAVQIGAVSGHSSKSIQTMMDRHYNSRSREQAQGAIDLIVGKLDRSVSRET